MELKRRVGILITSGDVVVEADLWRRLPEPFTLHSARMLLESVTVAGEMKMLREELEPAARRVASAHPELVIFACTSAAGLLGLEGDADIARRVEGITGCRCISVVQAAFTEIRRHPIERLMLLTPYTQEINERLQKTFREAGMPVISTAGLGLEGDPEIGAVPPEEIRGFVETNVRRASLAPDSVFVSCTNFRAFEVAEELEKELGIPVFTSNRGAFHAILSHWGERIPGETATVKDRSG